MFSMNGESLKQSRPENIAECHRMRWKIMPRVNMYTVSMTIVCASRNTSSHLIITDSLDEL